MQTRATLIECKKPKDDEVILMRFLIVDAPNNSSLPAYIEELQRNRVQHMVRVCSATYDSQLLESAGIHVHGWSFDDGAPPPEEVIANWLTLLQQVLDAYLSEAAAALKAKGLPPLPPTIAVHCIAGLGRAPVLVAIALMELGGLSPLDAASTVRDKRKGAINQVQLTWLMKYRPRMKLKEETSCALM